MSNLKALVVAGMVLATPAIAADKLVAMEGPDGTTVMVPPMAGKAPRAASSLVSGGPATSVYDGSSVNGMTCHLVQIGTSGWYAIQRSSNDGLAIALTSLESQRPYSFSPGQLLLCGFPPSSGLGWYEATGRFLGTPQ